MNASLQHAVSAIRSGDRETGQHVLRTILEVDPNNEQAWLWLSGISDCDEHRRHCMERVLAINPANTFAQRGLSSLLGRWQERLNSRETAQRETQERLVKVGQAHSRQRTLLAQEQQALAQRQTELQAQVEELKQQREALATDQRSLAQQRAALQTLAAELHDQQSVLAGEQHALVQQQSALQCSKAELDQLLLALANDQSSLAEQKVQLQAREAELVGKQNALKKRGDGVDRQKAKLSKQQVELEREQQTLLQQQNALMAREAEFEQRVRALEDSQKALAEQQAQVQRQEAELAEKQDQLDQQTRNNGQQETGNEKTSSATIDQRSILHNSLDPPVKEQGVYRLSDNVFRLFDDLICIPYNGKRRSDKWQAANVEEDQLAIIGRGQADFRQPARGLPPDDLVLLYCQSNMRMHFFSSYHIFDKHRDQLQNHLLDRGQAVVFVDIGCGPMTSGLAFKAFLSSLGVRRHLAYIGIDRAPAMLRKAAEFNKFNGGCFNAFDTAEDYLCIPDLIRRRVRDGEEPAIIFNMSYFFASPTLEIVDFTAMMRYLCAAYRRYKIGIFIQEPENYRPSAETCQFFLDSFQHLDVLALQKIETLRYRLSKESSVRVKYTALINQVTFTR